MENVNNWTLWRHKYADGTDAFPAVRTNNLDPDAAWTLSGDPRELDCLSCKGNGAIIDPADGQPHATTGETIHENDCVKLRRYLKMDNEQRKSLFSGPDWANDWASSV